MRRWHRELGLPVGLLYVAHRLLLAVSRGRARIVPYRLFAQPIGAGRYETVRNDPATEVRSVDRNTPVVGAFPRSREVNEKRFSEGHECWVALVKGEFAGHIWLARDRYVEDEVRCEYTWPSEPSCVWDFDVYVEPRFRMGRTMGRLWKGVDSALHGQNVLWSLSRISMFNPASSAAHASLAAVEIGRAIFIVLWSAQLAVSSIRPYASLTFSTGKGVPRLRLTAPPHPAGPRRAKAGAERSDR